jgi:hypothetical protein
VSLQHAEFLSFEAGPFRCAVSEGVVEESADGAVLTVRVVRVCPEPVRVERWHGLNVWLCQRHADELERRP